MPNRILATLLLLTLTMGCNNYKVHSFEHVRREKGDELLVLDMITEDWDQDADEYVTASGGLLYERMDTTDVIVVRSMQFIDCDGNTIYQCFNKQLEWRKFPRCDEFSILNGFDAKQLRFGDVKASVTLEMYDAGGPTNRIEMAGVIEATTMKVNRILYAH